MNLNHCKYIRVRKKLNQSTGSSCYHPEGSQQSSNSASIINQPEQTPENSSLIRHSRYQGSLTDFFESKCSSSFVVFESPNISKNCIQAATISHWKEAFDSEIQALKEHENGFLYLLMHQSFAAIGYTPLYLHQTDQLIVLKHPRVTSKNMESTTKKSLLQLLK